MDTGSAKPPERPKRRSIRLREYDYSQSGAYFVTVCVRNRECLLGEIVGGAILMNRYGLSTALTLEWLKERYAHVDLDEWIVMPNHVHAIILIDSRDVGAVPEPPVVGRDVGAVREPPVVGREKIKPLGGLVGAFKTVSSKKINQMRGTPGEMVWQRNYYEHVIRSENELERIRDYIYCNPQAWLSDPENPHARGGSARDRTGGSRTAPTGVQRGKQG
jgi:putative transposase